MITCSLQLASTDGKQQTALETFMIMQWEMVPLAKLMYLANAEGDQMHIACSVRAPTLIDAAMTYGSRARQQLEFHSSTQEVPISTLAGKNQVSSTHASLQ